MKSQIAAACALGVVLGLGLGLRAPARADAAGTAIEHKVVLLNYDDFKDTDVFKQAEKELGNTYLAVLRMQEIALNKLGAEGWELILIEAKTPAQTTAYLKRRK